MLKDLVMLFKELDRVVCAPKFGVNTQKQS